MPRKGQRRSQAFTPSHYNIEITGWDWDFSFSVNVPPDDERLYSDYRHLHIHGRALRPRKIKVETAELLFLPKAGLSEMVMEALTG